MDNWQGGFASAMQAGFTWRRKRKERRRREAAKGKKRERERGIDKDLPILGDGSKAFLLARPDL